MKYLLLSLGLLFLSCNSPSCKLATADNLCLDSCKKAYSHLENDKTEIVGIPTSEGMKGDLYCKCYSKTRNVK